MKKIVLILVIVIIAAGSSFAQSVVKDDPLFTPVLPEIIGQGGAFTANAHGYGALVTNPAGFSMKGGSFTLLTANVGPYFLPTKKALEGMRALTDNVDSNDMKGVSDLGYIMSSNGIGANVNAGLGIVGQGLGLGIIIDADTFGSGATTFSTSFDGVVTAAGIVGYSLKLGTDTFGINVGGDVRLMHRIKMNNIPVWDYILGSAGPVTATAGNALALDLGAILQLGSLSVGLSVRDLGGTQFRYSDPINVDGADLDALMGAGNDSRYKIPMSGTVGVSYHPDLGGLSFLFDPIVSFDYQKVFYAEDENTTSFWTGIHAGTEIKVLRFLKVRAGINQGYVTAGVGAKLLFIDINASYFTREMGRFAGSQPNQGLTMEAALRF